MSISFSIIYIIVVASSMQWTHAVITFDDCVYQILSQEPISDIDLEFSRAAFYEAVDHNVTPDCKAGIAPRKEISDVSNLIDHLYVEGCIGQPSEIKHMLQQVGCPVHISSAAEGNLHKIFMSHVYNSDADDERKYRTFVYSCCKFRFKAALTAGAYQYMRYLTKKQMIESTKETLGNMVKQSSSSTTTTQPKTTPGTKATTMPTLDPGSFTIDS